MIGFRLSHDVAPERLLHVLIGDDVQERRLENWCEEYPRNFERFRDSDGYGFSHTYFYPAEQYDRGLIQRLARRFSEPCGCDSKALPGVRSKVKG